MQLGNAVDPVTEEVVRLRAPVDRLLVPVNLSPSRGAGIVTSCRTCERARGIVGERRLQEWPLIRILAVVTRLESCDGIGIAFLRSKGWRPPLL